MSVPSLATQLVVQTKQIIYDLGLSIATALGLPVTSWGAGDPTRSTYWFLADVLETHDEMSRQYIRAGFLDTVDDDDAAALLADQQFGVEVPAATFATCEQALVNRGGGTYSEDENDLTFNNPATGATYRNTEAMTLASRIVTTVAAGSNGAILPQSTIHVGSTTSFPASGQIIIGTMFDDGLEGPSAIIAYTGKTATTFTGCTTDDDGFELQTGQEVHGSFDVIGIEAEAAGSDSSSSVGEITELVVALPGVITFNRTAAVGTDSPSIPEVRALCREKLGSLSPNGPKDAYSYVAKTEDLTGVTGITRVRTFPDSDTGVVLVYLAGPAGAVTADERDAAEEAILEWATPLCITPVVASADAHAINVTATLWIYSSVNKTEAEVEEAVEAALDELFRTRPIGGDIIPPATTGAIYASTILHAIEDAFPEHTFRVTVSSPAGDTALANTEVATTGTVTLTINFVSSP